MPTIGIAEGVVVALVAIISYGIPIAAAIWIIITLNRIQTGQKSIQSRLEEIEHAVRQGRSGGQPV